jgi:hypothetical protein
MLSLALATFFFGMAFGVALSYPIFIHIAKRAGIEAYLNEKRKEI